MINSIILNQSRIDEFIIIEIEIENNEGDKAKFKML